MSSLSLFSVYLSGASLILLLTAVCHADYYDFNATPDYDSDYNTTFEYSFFSNTSNEELDKFSETIIGEQDEEEPEDDTGGESDEPEVAVTVATTKATTRQRSAASPLLCSEIWTLLWSLMVLIAMNTEQLQHTL